MILFPFPPNWAAPVREIIEWKTDVFRSHNGTEQRRSLRHLPRRSFDYSVLLKGADCDLLESILWGESTNDMLVPIWTDMSRSTAEATVGATTIDVDTTLRSYVVGGYVVLYASSTSHEFAEISAITDTQITVNAPLAATWPAGTKVYPAAAARLATSTKTARHTNRVVTAAISFLLSPENCYSYLPDAVANVIYDNLEVVTNPLNWRQAITNDFGRDVMIADAGVGAVAYFDKEDYTRISRPFEVLLRSKSDILVFRRFIARRRGQTVPCWIPSWHGDFTINDTTTVGSMVLTVARTDFDSLVGVDTNRDRIRIRLNDGTAYYRRIVSMAVVGNDTQLTLDDDFPVELNTSNVLAVDFLLRCRLAADRIELAWHTDGVATSTMTFTTVNA